jgi:hypothetical protein
MRLPASRVAGGLRWRLPGEAMVELEGGGELLCRIGVGMVIGAGRLPPWRAGGGAILPYLVGI